MKILYAFPEELPLPRARGIQACSTVAALSQKAQVLLVAPFKKDPFSFYEIYPYNVACFHLPRKYGPIRNTFIWTLLLHLVAFKWKPDFLFVRHPKVGYYVAKLNKIPFVYEAHDILKTKHPENKKLHLKEEFFIKRAQGIITVSKGLLKDLKKFYSPLPPVEVVPSGTFLSPFAKNKKFSYHKINDIYYLGTIYYDWKGLDILKSALELQSGLILHLIGTSKVIHHRVKVYGWCNRNRIMHLLSKAEIGILPNTGKSIISRYYTCPLKLLEYLGNKMAVVAADLPSVRELVSEKEVLFFEPDNPKSLTEAIQRLTQNSKLRERLASAAYEKAKEFTWENRARKLYRFLREELGLT